MSVIQLLLLLLLIIIIISWVISNPVSVSVEELNQCTGLKITQRWEAARSALARLSSWPVFILFLF